MYENARHTINHHISFGTNHRVPRTVRTQYTGRFHFYFYSDNSSDKTLESFVDVSQIYPGRKTKEK